MADRKRVRGEPDGSESDQEKFRGVADGKADKSTSEDRSSGALDSPAGEPQDLDAVFDIIKKLVKVVLEIVISTNKEITNLKVQGVDANYNAKDAYDDVLQLVSAAHGFIDKVDDFFEDGEQVTRRLATSIRRGNTAIFFASLTQLHSTLSGIETVYQELRKACEVAKTKSKKAGVEVKKQKAQLEGMKSSTMTKIAVKAVTCISLPTTAGLIGGTIPFSILAIIAGVGIGYGAYSTARDYHEVQKSFQNLDDKFDVLDFTIMHIKTTITSINRLLTAMADRVKSVEAEANGCVQGLKKVRLNGGAQASKDNGQDSEHEDDHLDETIDDLVSLARRLHEKLKEGHTVTASAKKSIEVEEQKMKNELQKLH